VSISNEVCDVFHEDVAGSNQANDGLHPGPSPAFVADAAAEAGGAERLAGEAAADEVDGRSRGRQPPLSCGSDVIVLWHLRPVLREDTPAEGIDLDLPDDGHPCPLKP
jgi:hypothetical protein